MKIVKDNIEDKVFQTWFAPVVPIDYQGDEFTVQVPSSFFYEYLEEHYADLIYASLFRVAGKDLHLHYRITVDTSNKKGGCTTVQSERLTSAKEANKTATQLNKHPNTLVPATEWNPNLNPRLSFQNFFEGKSNLLARSVGESICENLNKTFNPLFIHGCAGVGKTHLCHAIGNRMVERFPEKKVMYISSHLFQVQFTDAARNNVSNDFINFYQGIDMLIVDDIQELAGKEKTQKAYFHIFNHLHLLGKQIILTSDKTPAELQGIEERLISRFKWGAVIEMYKPDAELRKKILRNKIKQNGLEIPEDILEYIAENVTEHIRDLEGIITSLVAHSLVCNCEIDLELAKRVVNKSVKIEKKPITSDNIQTVVSTYFNIDLKEIHSKSRKRDIVLARQVAMFLLKKHTDYSYSRIGSMVGKRDHATVLHAYRTVQNRLEIDKTFRVTMGNIETLLTK
jgi:chromosomal replication initiator protein